MSSTCVAELETVLQSMLAMKPPGVSNSKIKSIEALCNANVQSESVLIQKIYTHFKKTPGTHKLGVLYVVDSVTRQWLDLARKAGQVVGPSAADGSFAAGVNHVTELLPSFVTDTINNASKEQKDRIEKLLNIWERGNTFPAAMLTNFKEKLKAAQNGKMRLVHAKIGISSLVESKTPDGSPPPQATAFMNSQAATNGAAPPAAATDTSAILASLQAMANFAKQNPPASAAPAMPIQSNPPANVGYPTTHTPVPQPQSVPSVNPGVGMSLPGQGVNMSGLMGNASNGVFPYPNMNGMPQNFFPGMPNPQPNVQTQPQPMMPQAVPDMLQQQINLIQALQQRGIPQDQWGPVLAALMPAQSGVAAGNVPAANAFGNPMGMPSDQSRDRNGYDSGIRSPSYRNRQGRSRSRSPGSWDRRRESPPPRRRDSPTYNSYGDDRRGRGGRGGNSGSNPYRMRSPDRSRRSPSPRRQNQSNPQIERRIEIDRSLGQGMIKVLSRTLFVGGVTCPEDHLRDIFVKFGRVQTCIVNIDKRHAFVKMYTRDEAVAAKEQMDHFRSPEMQLRTRWGVGFGPRDCSDYQTGISIIPIERLTDADRKWLLTAEYGGTGGKTIDSGMVVEEPDIEIGAGVSSKAISRRMQTDKSGHQGPRSTRDPPPRYRQPDSRPSDHDRTGSNVSSNNGNNNSSNNSNNAGTSMPAIGLNGGNNATGNSANPFANIPGFPFQMSPGMNFQQFLTQATTPMNQQPSQPPPPGAS
ncbi:hypothetical protein MMC25_006176 [Agyrium rufum]|nr:hypothetical protein [Agyrium rufum]